MSDNKLLNLLKSGNFTIAFHDRNMVSLYEGKYDYDELPETEDYQFDLCDSHKGYAPYIMCVLVKSLNGKIESI